jgi:hypothetical protein
MKIIRASKLPLALACPQSQIPPAVLIAGDDEASRLGTAVHLRVADAITEGGYDLIDVQDHAAFAGVDADELGMLVGIAMRIWRETLAPSFPDPVIEESVEVNVGDSTLKLTGHPDLMTLVGTEIRGIDWKSGRVEGENVEDQMRGYAALGFARWPEAETCRWSVLWIREQELVTYPERPDAPSWTRAEIEAWADGLPAWLAVEEYRPGQHCRYCKRRFECPARHTQLQHITGWILDTPYDDVASWLSVADAVKLIRDVEAQCKAALSAIKTEVLARGGSIPGLTIREQQNREIDVDRGWDLLVDAVGEPTLRRLLKASIGDVETAIKATAAKGQKGTRLKEFFGGLVTANAIRINTKQILEVENVSSSSNTKRLTSGDTATAATE